MSVLPGLESEPVTHKGFWLRGVVCGVLVAGCFLPAAAGTVGLESFESILTKAKSPLSQAQLWLFDYLNLYQNNASLFSEFGVCTSMQKQALSQTVPRAMALLEKLDAKTARTVPAQFTLAYGLYLTQLKDQAVRSDCLKKGAAILVQLLAEPTDPWQIHTRGRCLLGRIRLAQGRLDQALELFRKVVEEHVLDLNHLAAHLGRVVAWDRLKRSDLADASLAKLEDHPLVKKNLLLRLLLVDVQHRRSHSYEPYFALLADKTIQRQAPALTFYIHQRWVQNIVLGQDLSTLPAAVVAAMGKQLRIEGQNMALDHDPAAKGRLQWAYRVNDALIQRTTLSPAQRTTAEFNRAMSLYYQNTDDDNNAVAVALLLTQMAKKNPSDTLAVTGISYAIELLRSQRQTASYRQCAKVLFEQFTTSEAADDERLAYAVTILIPQKQFTQAMALLAGVPISHGAYFEAQRERLYCMAHDPSLASLLASEAVRLCDEAARLKTPQSLNAAGHAKRILSDMAYAQKKWKQSLQWLDGFEQLYPLDDSLRVMKHQRQIAVLMQLDQAQADLAVSLSQKLLNEAAQWNMSEEELLPIKLAQARAWRALGKLVQAKRVLGLLVEQFDHDALVIHELAQTCFELGSEADLIEAERSYQKLIEGLSVEDPHYWNAWMRYLQICDRTGRHANIIADRVRTLRASDPALGGEPYQSELRRLSEKYATDP